MQNPFQQNNAGNMGGMNDPLGFVKKLWGDMQLPGMVTPTLSVDELDKQIKDLKTVESWLTVNMNMLKGTIQALEVQRATISALKTMGESFAQARTHSESVTASAFSSQWPMPEKGVDTKAASKQTVPEPAVEDEMDEEEFENEDAVDVHKSAVAPDAEVTAAEQKTEAKQTATKPEVSSFSNPAAWWTVLQDQFKQALHHAMQDEGAAKANEPTKPTKSTKVASTKAKTSTSIRNKPAASVKNKSSGIGIAAKIAAKPVTKPVTKSATKSVTKAKPASKTKSVSKTSVKPVSTRKPKLA